MGLFPLKNFQFLRAFSIFVGEKKKRGGCPVTDHFVEVLDPDGQAADSVDGWVGYQLSSDQLTLVMAAACRG